MSGAPVQVANERRKALSSVMFNLGTALIAAIAARAYGEPQFDAWLILWSSGAIALMWVGWMILSLLEPET